MSRWGHVAVRSTLALFAFAYPIVIYVAIDAWAPRALALVVAIGFGGLILYRNSREGTGRATIPVVPWIPALGLALATAWFDDARILLWAPVLINACLFVVFAWSLRADAIPMIEQFARLREPALGRLGVRHCRRVTVAWCVFFILNGGVAGALALAGRPRLWAVYNGGLAYGLMGLMFVGEYVVRRYVLRSQV